MIAKFITHFTLQIMLLLGVGTLIHKVMDLFGIKNYDSLIDTLNHSVGVWFIMTGGVVLVVKGTRYIRRFINFIQD